MANDILYDLTPWEDAPSTLTPINAENLNARDGLLKKVVDKTNQLQEQKVDKQDGYSMVSDSEKQAWNNKSDFSGSYNDLKDKPEIPEGADLTGYATEDYVKDYAQPKGNYLTEHQDLSGYALKEEIPTVPEKLPNPNSLTFTGAVTGSYDGSNPLAVEIPSGGSGWENDFFLRETLLDITLTENVQEVSVNLDLEETYSVMIEADLEVCEAISTFGPVLIDCMNVELLRQNALPYLGYDKSESTGGKIIWLATLSEYGAMRISVTGSTNWQSDSGGGLTNKRSDVLRIRTWGDSYFPVGSKIRFTATKKFLK